VTGEADPQSLAGRRVLVTGGSGFIGSHVIPALLAQGAVVSSVDLVEPAQSVPGVPTLIGDLTNPDVVQAAVADDIESVVHLAAATSVLVSIERPARTMDVNVTATAALLERCREVGVGSFVFASTNAVAGPVPPDRRIDEQVVLRPLTPYGASKAASEMLMSAYTAVYGVRCVPLRFTNVYGPGMTGKDSIVARIMRAALSDGAMTVYGAGKQVRDYVYVEDVAAAVSLAVRRSDIDGPVVIGAGESYSVLDILALARGATGAALPAEHVPAKAGEMPRVIVDPSYARSLGWQPAVDLTEGLRRVWEWWPRDHAAAQSDQSGQPAQLAGQA
jgi:UDP-glucose 4-epimerase